MNFPDLKPVSRDREYKKCSDKIRDKVLYEYLFNGKSHRWLDENIIGLEVEYSRGYMAMGILHYLGIVEVHKAIFQNIKITYAIRMLTEKDYEKYKNIILSLIRYSENIYSSDSLNCFIPNTNIPELIKTVGTSQYTDGVRIEKAYHDIYNPKKSPFYVKRGMARPIEILFNNKVFNAEYRYENQTDKSVELQSIRFRKDLKDEFKKVFPEPNGEFTIQVGSDLNHFVFSHLSGNVYEIEDANEYPEGKVAYKTHRIRERNPEVVRKAKEVFSRKNDGKLYCEVCKFNFVENYGERGADYIEGHHKKLISEMKEGEKTKVEDIALLCANCHRMIHRKPLISIEELGKIVETNRNVSN